MAKKSTGSGERADSVPAEQSKTVIKAKQPTRTVQPKTKIKAKQQTRVVERVTTIIQKEKPQGTKWLGASPWVVIAGIIAVALLVFLPIFPAEKIVDKTETIMVPVTKEREEQVTANETIKTYTGYMEQKGVNELRTGYNTETRSQLIGYDNWGDPVYRTYTENVPYTYYDTVAGKTTTIDAVAEIIEVQRARGPDDTWILTLTAQDGTQVVYRDIVKDDLTKTGKATVSVTKTVSKPYTEQVPKEVVKQEIQKFRVNLISLVLQDY
jgi:hypothetical protein